ncbi:ABC transporter ATP-binding protein [Anaerosinus massiliensis]|uniref:ABC transporter ATP-binding protein n=1 Tax=Massilibacillus massiliensis TaxID=1806837 RepID=UPI000AB07960|nr:ABC transporter ATP-binding protein [Massilibacillus massiliensis]
MLEVENIYKSYKKQKNFFCSSHKQSVLQDVSFAVNSGECVGLVGESSSGKSTLSRLILNLERPDSGRILMEGQPIQKWLRTHRGAVSVVFQDYTTSVNPRFTVEQIVAEPLKILHKPLSKDCIVNLLETVNISSGFMKRYPHELSGGQLQRVCLARAISTTPRFIVLDEALSSLDVSIQAQMLQLLKKLKQQMGITYLFIAHDLQTLTNLCDKVLFLYQGKIVEEAYSQNLYKVNHIYAKRLLESVLPFGERWK